MDAGGAEGGVKFGGGPGGEIGGTEGSPSLPFEPFAPLVPLLSWTAELLESLTGCKSGEGTGAKTGWSKRFSFTLANA